MVGGIRCKGACLVSGPDILEQRPDSCTFASTPAVTGWVLWRKFRLILGQCKHQENIAVWPRGKKWVCYEVCWALATIFATTRQCRKAKKVVAFLLIFLILSRVRFREEMLSRCRLSRNETFVVWPALIMSHAHKHRLCTLNGTVFVQCAKSCNSCWQNSIFANQTTWWGARTEWPHFLGAGILLYKCATLSPPPTKKYVLETGSVGEKYFSIYNANVG